MTRYAEGTSVAAERSRAELERILRRFGAQSFGYAWDERTGLEQIGFRIGGRSVRMSLPLPTIEDPLIALTPGGKRRTFIQADAALQQETRRRWRSLVLVVKAKLTAVDDGISTVEREFLADLVLPSGQTTHEWMAPQLPTIEDGNMPRAIDR